MSDTVCPERIVIENIQPQIDAGRFPAKSEVGESFRVTCDAFIDGHEMIRVHLLHRADDEEEWSETPMVHEGNDRWSGRFPLTANTRYHYTIIAWEDRFGSWLRDTRKKIEAGQDVALEMREGKILVEQTIAAMEPETARDHGTLLKTLAKLTGESLMTDLLSDTRAAMMTRHDPRVHLTMAENELTVIADRERARFSNWYEFFPRSAGTDPTRSATFREAESLLPGIRQMGFHVVYLTPIHPIGEKHRKGRNNSVTAQPGEPGSPYAISDHKAVHPELGTLEDFRRFVAATHEHGMEVALDFAIQCAPDHPYVTDHPEWFVQRPDGTIKYAENPPKKYQDIVNVDFFCDDWEALWEELRSIVVFWIEQGVKIFRVDNPHTKAFAFWEWMIGSIQEAYPDTIFLSEAFTRPKVMYQLAKSGYAQSYTYFTWRNTKAELTEYLTELAQGEPKDFYRPNFFANTPDILPKYLQESGRPGFIIRAALAGLLAANYGLYSGYEFCEATPLAPGKEEYLDSEKYEFKVRDWNKPGNIKEFIAKLNYIRGENRALQYLTNLKFHLSDNEQVLFFSKATDDRSNIVFGAVNLDPFRMQEASIDMPLWEYGIDEYRPYRLDDLLAGHSWEWYGRTQRQHLDPHTNPVAIFRISRFQP